MAGFDHEPERDWDEYDWERFLQQQDHKTEKYMELLEKYLDDPNRDQIIAREMGWTQLLDGRDWTQEVDALMEEEEEEKSTPADSFEDHSLYRAAFALTVWIDHMFDQDAVVLQRLFQVRDGIITLIGEYRCEWRRRFGSEGFQG